jgi:hypothetical protein
MSQIMVRYNMFVLALVLMVVLCVLIRKKIKK